VWGALWPVLTGVALAAGLWRWGDRLPRVPEGDIAVFLDVLARAAARWGAWVERVDEFVRRWPVAVASLLAIAIALSAAMWTRS
jgi:hypothetical protein